MNKQTNSQKTNIFPLGIILISLLTLTILLLSLISSCSRPSNKMIPSAPIRLLDILEEENVINSPFSSVEKNFIPFQEDHQNDVLFIPELSSSGIKCWSIMTNHPILTYGEANKPYFLQVYFNNSLLPPIEEKKGDEIAWQLIKISKKVDLSSDENYNKGFQCVLLDLDKALSFEFIAPPSPLELQIKARRNWHPSSMVIAIDGNPIKVIELERSNRIYKLALNLRPGTHHFSIRPQLKGPRQSGGPTPPRILIFEVNLHSNNDLINFYVPSTREDEFKKGLIKIEYNSTQLTDGQINPYTPLLQLKYENIIHPSIYPVNPENIKKKIDFNNRAIDVLMAPPESRFEFDLKIPENAILDFGVGILAEEDRSPLPPKIADFKVIIDGSEKEELLFHSSLPLNKGESPFFQDEKIDLKDYQGKKVKLILETSLSDKSYPHKDIFSFWFNPLIYVPQLDSPKIILVSLDTLRADHLGCYGYQRDTSPHLDALAKESVLFENVYAQSSWTLPSHTSMLFSLNSASHQVYYNDQRIDPSLPSLASILQKAGFLPYAFTGGGYVSYIYGFAKGFHWYEEPAGGRHAPLARDEAERLAMFTTDWIKKNKDKPFFLFLHTFQIHGPYDTPPPWNQKFLPEKAKWTRIALRQYLEKDENGPLLTREEIENIIALYDAEIFYTDATLIKKLIDSLKANGIYDHTLLIVTSDHGEEFYDHKGWLHGQTLYEEQLRVPLIIKFPHSNYKGKRLTPKVRLIDILPTVMEALNLPYKAKLFEGKSLLPIVEENEKEDRTFISDLAHKDVLDPCPVLIATNSKDLKIIVEKAVEGIKNMEIYDLAQDPTEQNNLLRQKRQLGMELLEKLEKYYEQKFSLVRKTGKVILDEKLKEKLKALGYIK